MKIIQVILFLFLSAYSSINEVNSTASPALLGGELVGNVTLSPTQGPFTVGKDVVVPEGSTLTIKPGVQIFFRPNAGLKVVGSLIAKGSPENKIWFSSLAYPNASSNASFYYGDGIRLVDGRTYSEGRLEILRHGQWGVICGQYWQSKSTDVACRQLGFLRAKRYFRAYSDPTKSYLMSAVECKGSEVSLLHCYYRTGSNWNSYQIGIECEYLQNYLQEHVKWQGMSFEMTSNASTVSVLKHVNIKDAVLALNITRKAPTISSITISNCINGIQARDIMNKFELTNSVLTDNVLSGTRITNSLLDILIQNSSFTKTALGIGFSIEEDRVASDFCTWNQSWTPKYPLVLRATSQSYIHCNKIIKAEENSTLALHYRNITGSSLRFNVFSKDDRGNWTLISSVNENDAGKMHKVITSKTNALWISYSNSQGSRSSIEFVIVNTKETKSAIISDSSFVDNGLHGAQIVDFIGLLQINDTKVNQNKHDGMYINGLYGEIIKFNFDAANNSLMGLHLERISGIVNMESIRIVSNKQDGIMTNKGTGILLIKRGLISENARHGVYIGSQRDTYIHLSNLDVSQNTQNALFLEKTVNGSVKFLNITATRNKKSGTYFLSCQTPVGIERSFADDNGRHGFYFQTQGGSVTFVDFTASRNQESGLRVDDGISRLFLKHGILKGNNKHGFHLNNHGKEILMVNVSIINNKERGISVYENSRAQGNRITLFSVSNCYISGSKVGLNLLFACVYKLNSERNVSIQLRSNTFFNNSLEAFGFYKEYTCYYSTAPRQVGSLKFPGERETFTEMSLVFVHVSR